MIVKFFGKTYPITIIVITIIAILTQLPCIIFPERFFGMSESDSPIMSLIRYVYNFSPIITSLILLICFLACLLLVSRINTNNFLISKASLLPPIIFALLFQFQLYNPALIANMLILISINRLLNLTSKDNDNHSEVDFFAAGFMVGIATLTDLSAVIFLLFIIIAVFVIDTSYRFRDVLIIITGFTLPIIIWLFIEFAAGNIEKLTTQFDPIFVNFEIFKNNISIFDYAIIIYYAVLIIFSIGFVVKRLHTMSLAIRNKYTFIIIILFISLILVVLLNNPVIYIMMAIPLLSIILSYTLTNIKTIWADIFFCLIAVLPLFHLLIEFNVNA
ncbi:DUF6427 family protein [Odoribacter sp. OttesenSCG-928-L07]|nr:DUF6427 family protein [Odoribacter sp. OttesenSCG-928-L07]